MAASLKVSDFDYPLEPELIAQVPSGARDQSNLMVLRRSDASISHHVFSELPELLSEGDLLVINDTRVIPAKFTSHRKTGARIEGLFLREIAPGRWEVMLKNAGRCTRGERVSLDDSEEVELELDEHVGEGNWIVNIYPPTPAAEILDEAGSTPLPPYIRHQGADAELEDHQRYQTIYAKHAGAVAAPTAGLHFTEGVFEALASRGIETVSVTLHVGLGTFAPVKCEDLSQHEMHREFCEVTQETASAINVAREDHRRIVAVGSTSLRVLEAMGRSAPDGKLQGFSGWTDLFIYPPAEFQVVGALITNFHLPRSTLLMLVGSFCCPGGTDGLEMILNAYAEARRLRYRFYSYGDAMLIE